MIAAQGQRAAAGGYVLSPRVGCDLVEVAPAYDLSGNIALLAANLLFEMLCVMPGAVYRQ